MMKHAVMIMAHKNLEQVVRLIRTLKCPCFDFYIHFDAQFELSEANIEKIKDAEGNVFFCKNRIHGELDKWSLPQIVLNLIDLILHNEQETGVSYSYFLLLSGQDYPIKSNEYICDFLKKQYPIPLIDVDEYREGTWIESKFMLIKWAQKIDEMHNKYKSGIYRKIKVVPYAIADFCERYFIGTPYDRLTKLGVQICGGSAWWILPHEVIDHLQEFRKNKKIMKILKKTWTPEETFFQIVTMSSTLAPLVLKKSDIYEKGDQRCMTYANFRTPTKHFTGHPHDITVEDFDRIIKKPQLFARKFDINTDEKILDMIDEVIKMEKVKIGNFEVHI